MLFIKSTCENFHRMYTIITNLKRTSDHLDSAALPLLECVIGRRYKLS